MLGLRESSAYPDRTILGATLEYTLVVAGGDTDIKPVPAIELEARIRRAHSLIWAGGRRDIPFPS